MSYRDDAVDLISNQIDKEKKERGENVSPVKRTIKLDISQEEVNDMASNIGVATSGEEPEDEQNEEGDE